jgi:hypothetical protein
MLYRSSKLIIAVLPVTGLLASCANNGDSLPENPIERAATCYAAAIARISATPGAVTPEQANQAAQFAYLGAITDGIAEPSKLAEVMEKGTKLRPDIEKAATTGGYDAACANAYPQTVVGAFKGLPADERAARMICFTLSTAAMQVYQSSSITAPVATASLNKKLDAELREEINAAGDVNPAELAGFAMRSMARAVELGPMNDVLAACTTKYGALAEVPESG